MTHTTTLSLFRFNKPTDRLWAFYMMARARFDLARMPDLKFWKLMGSGIGEGFTPNPNTAVWAILATWPDERSARANIDTAPLFKRYQNRATEHWTIFLQATSARGAWSGQAPFEPDATARPGPLAALTRATVKPRILPNFWGQVPSISKMIGADPNVIFKIGVGEVPWLHQVTFSIWPGTEEMAAFARRDGPHAKAIKAVRDGDWFREELYARFQIVGDCGAWGGTSPLQRISQ